MRPDFRRTALAVSLTVLTAAAVGILTSLPPAAPEPGVYWATVLKEGQTAPARASFGMAPETSGICHISKDAATGRLVFVIPHPCATLLRTIEPDRAGFHGLPPSADDTYAGPLTGLRLPNGVYIVTAPESDGPRRMAIRLAEAQGK